MVPAPYPIGLVEIEEFETFLIIGEMNRAVAVVGTTHTLFTDTALGQVEIAFHVTAGV